MVRERERDGLLELKSAAPFSMNNLFSTFILITFPFPLLSPVPTKDPTRMLVFACCSVPETAPLIRTEVLTGPATTAVFYSCGFCLVGWVLFSFLFYFFALETKFYRTVLLSLGKEWSIYLLRLLCYVSALQDLLSVKDLEFVVYVALQPFFNLLVNV